MRKLTIRSVSVLAALAIASLALVPLGSARTDRQTAPEATAIQVKGGEFFFRLSKRTLPKPGKVTFTFKNIGHVLHDLRIKGKTTRLLQPGKSATLAVVFKKGRYPYLCTVPGHAASGMKGVFIVR